MSVDLRTAPSASTLIAASTSAPGAMCTASGPAAFSIASDGSPAVPRLASTWVRGTALPATVRASEQVQQALDRAADSFQGISGTAYAFHASIMLRHLGVLADGLTRAAALFESYAERLVAHERLLSGVRARAVAAGFPVTGDLVGAPDGPADSGDWSTMAAEVAANAGATVEVMTPDRTFAPDIMAMNLVPYMRALQDKDVTFTVTRRLLDVLRDGNELKAVIGTDYSDLRTEKRYDQVVVNYGTLPMDELYFDLKPLSSNGGAVDYDALIDGQTQTVTRGPADGFQLFRIGDAVSARNTHAAIYDALRLVKDI